MTRRPKHPSSFVESYARQSKGASDNRAGTDVPHVVPASESEIGGIEHDERGHARWKWKTDVAASADPTAETFNFLKALDTALEVDRSQKLRTLKESMKTGLNPYDTGRVEKPK